MLGANWAVARGGRGHLRLRPLSLALLVICAFAILLAPAARAGKIKVGEFGTPSGEEKGQLNGPKGVAVNLGGVGGVAVGDVYVVDSENNRIEEFTATGDFVRAWGVDVVASGPDDAGSGFEICLAADVCKAGSRSAAAGGMSLPTGIAIDQANGNVYVVDAESNELVTNSRVSVYSASGAFEGAFGWNVNATTPEEKLQFCTLATGCQKGTFGDGVGQLGTGSISLPAVGPSGHFYLPNGGNQRVDEFAPTLNGSGEVTGISFVKAFGWDVVASGPDQSSETQKIKIKATGGAYKLTFEGQQTAPIEYNANAAEVESTLNALASITAIGSVDVSGGPGDATGKAPYSVSFLSSPKGKDVPSLVAAKAGLIGSVEVETYNDGGKGLEACVVAAGDTCKTGTEGGHMGQFGAGNPPSVAVDSSGAVYAVSQGTKINCNPDPFDSPCRVYKFAFPSVGEVVAEEFAPTQLTRVSGSPGAQNPTDVAVDPADHVLVAKREGNEAYKFLEFNSAGTLLEESPGEGTLEAVLGSGYHGLAIGTAGRFYFASPKGEVNIFGPPPAPTVTIGSVTSIGKTTATFHGTVTPPPPGPKGEHFKTTYHFEVSTDGGLNWSRFPASDVGVGDGSGLGVPGSCATENPSTCTVEQTDNELQSGTHYEVRLVATTGTATIAGPVPFDTEAGAPSISGTRVEQIGRASVVLTGFVNPNGDATTYHFECGATTAYGTNVPAGPELSAGAGGAPVSVSVNLTGLAEATVYHCRLVATNSSGTSDGPDREFVTLDEFGLPDGRAPELVSPADKRPVGQVGQIASSQIIFQAAADGNSTLYPLLNGLPDATAGGNVEYLGIRGAPGWLSSQITPPALVPPTETGIGLDATGFVRYASADLSCQVIESFEPLTPDTPVADVEHGVRNLYRRYPNGTYALLTTPVPSNFVTDPNATKYHVDWASDDCSHVLFDSQYGFVAGAVTGGGLRPLYEWVNGTLRLAGMRPNESVASDAEAGGSGTNWNSMSADGSRVFFNAESKEGGDNHQKAIFLREDGTETKDVSQSQTGTPNDGISRYQLATADGSHVFFTARYGLAPNGTSTGATKCEGGGEGCDLYDYDVDSETLTDLSADSNSADIGGAGVVGLFDASDDGSYVYFAARGQLVSNRGNTEAQNLLGAGFFNTYLRHNGVLSFVGLISEADTVANADGGANLASSQSSWVADATPDGTHLLFVSKANVTGYVSGGVTEAYLYSAATGETVCVSCRVDGQVSQGSGATEPIAAQVQAETASGSGPQNRPRSISEDGRRIFFKMPDVLAPGAKDGARNIYEWENGQVYLLLAGEGDEAGADFTEYADASAGGDDVFVVTKSRLVGQDFDGTKDLYDLRAPHIPGEKVGFPSPPPPPTPCDPLADVCQGPIAPQSGTSADPLTEGTSAPGNQPTPKPQPRTPHKGKKGKKHHHKKKHGRGHHKRAAGNNGRDVR